MAAWTLAARFSLASEGLRGVRTDVGKSVEEARSQQKTLREGSWEAVDKNDEGYVIQPQHPVFHSGEAACSLLFLLRESTSEIRDF